MDSQIKRAGRVCHEFAHWAPGSSFSAQQRLALHVLTQVLLLPLNAKNLQSGTLNLLQNIFSKPKNKSLKFKNHDIILLIQAIHAEK